MRSTKPRHSAQSGRNPLSGPWGAEFPSSSSTIGVNDNSNVRKAFGGGRRGRKADAAADDATAVAAPPPQRWVRRLRGVVPFLWAAWRREMECARSVRALQELDDRSLRDIGIGHRSDIEYMVRYGHTRR
jgi:uncharacterized protein YjiS (DUF1127 family)